MSVSTLRNSLDRFDDMDKETMLVLKQIEREREATMNVVRENYIEGDFNGDHHEHLVSRGVHLHARAAEIFTSQDDDGVKPLRKSIDKALSSLFSLTNETKNASKKSAAGMRGRKRGVGKRPLATETGRIDPGLAEKEAANEFEQFMT